MPDERDSVSDSDSDPVCLECVLAGLHLELAIFVAALAIPQPNLNPNPNRPNVAQTPTITNCLLLLPAGGPRLCLCIPLYVPLSWGIHQLLVIAIRKSSAKFSAIC